MTYQKQLSDGVVIEISNRKNNRSGYTGATLSVSWSLDCDKPFIACCGNPADPEIHAQLHARERTCWQGGSYADAREAAYVVARFKEDPVVIDDLIHNHGAFTDFPADLYDLPEGLSYDAAVELLDNALLLKKPGTRQKRAKIVRAGRYDHEVVEVGFHKHYDKNGYPILKALIAKYGRVTVKSAYESNLTVREFINLFDITPEFVADATQAVTA